jgi:endonuclease YncB( thermonuclease family)
VLAGAGVIGALIGSGPLSHVEFPQPQFAERDNGDLLEPCIVVDGDTLRCGGERIRLLGIDAAELPGHCRPGRNCVAGDPHAATASLNDAIRGELRIQRFGVDHYGRTLATISGSNGDLSCWQLGHGQAIYKPQWDEAGRVSRACPGETNWLR